MRFIYEYRTKDNVRHDGVIAAADRESVYAILKQRGIRPGCVKEAPGFLNKFLGKGKRWSAIVILFLASVGTFAYAVRMKGEVRSSSQGIISSARQQVIGDTAVIEKGIKTGWADVFDSEGERFLASFAIPGVPAGQRNTSEKEILASLDRKIAANAGDALEARQIKAMVDGMKDELRAYLAAGGDVIGYGQRLVQRQEEEIGYYSRAKAEIDAAFARGENVIELWERRNAMLRRMGVRLVPLPE